MAKKQKKTVKVKAKARNARVKGYKDNTSSPERDRQRWVEGIVTILIGVYCYYAFITAQPTLIDRIIGKYILMYLFGNAVPVLCLIVIACGILMLIDKFREYKETISYIILMTGNFMVFLSSNIPNLTTNYKIIDLFSLAAYGGYGGIVGTLIAYLLNKIITRTGTIIILILLTLVEVYLIIKINFPNLYSNIIGTDFGMVYIKNKYYDLKEDLDQRKRVRERQKKEEQKLQSSKELIIDEDDVDPYSIDDSVNYDDDLIEDDFIELEPDEIILDDSEPKKGVTEKSAEIPEDQVDLLDQYMFFDPEPEEEPPFIVEDFDEELSNKKKVNLNTGYDFPSIELLNKNSKKSRIDEKEIKDNARKIKETLNNFGVDASIRNFEKGPTITRFEVKPAPGVKVSKIVNLADDLALALATSDIRIEAPIPGKDAIGIEVPNKKSDIVPIRDIIETDEFINSKFDLPFSVGKTLSGHNIIGDISSMPHLLIAGSTGSGKSVCINSILISLLYHESPEDLKLILIDPKMVELSHYNSIPHLLVPVVTEPQKAEGALNWALKEMEERYNMFQQTGVRDLESYNELMIRNQGEKLPRIVIIIDELADLMMTSPKEVEGAICRIAQKARACGIHLIIATQRPSVDVITGLIKSNIPSRIAFAVASNTDSRTILDSAGAEKLLGKGDMLYKPVGLSKPLRIQCCFVSDNEINKVIESVKLEEEPEYSEEIEESIQHHVREKELKENSKKRDKLYDQAIEVAFLNKQVSTSMLQRKLGIGYARAGRIIDSLELDGIISGPNGSKPRKLLISESEYRGTA